MASVVRSGLTPIDGLRAARRDAEPGHHLVENQQHTVLAGQLAQAGQKRGIDRQPRAMRPGRLQDRRGNIVMALQEPRQPLGVVLLGQEHAAGNAWQDAGRRRAVEMARIARGHVVVPAVEMVLEADDLVLAGKGAGEAQRHQRRLGARRGEPHPLGRGDEPHDPFGPFDLGLVAGAEMGPALDLLMHRLDHLRVAMAEQQRAVPAEIIDIAMPVDIPFARALGAGDIDPVGLDIARNHG